MKSASTISTSGHALRHDWTREEVRSIYDQPLLELVFQAQQVHRQHHNPQEVQTCRLLSIKTGGCPEDCGYCPQSAHYETGVERAALMDVDDVLARARQAKSEGSTRFCMGAAWREVRDGGDFDAVLEMVRGVAALDMEVCCTLGMLTAEQARAPGRGRTHRLQPQPGHFARVLRQHHHHAEL